MAERDPQAQQPTDAPPQAETAGDSAGANVAALEQQLAEARQKAEENWNQFLRSRAEVDNMRRRAERDVEQAHKFALEKFSGELLAVRDSMELGLIAASEPGTDIGKLREGLELTLRMLKQTMDKFNVVEVNPLGEKFDPARHEAMAAQESREHEPNTVMHVVQKGYLLNDRLLRPAMVIVSRAATQREGGGIDEQV